VKNGQLVEITWRRCPRRPDPLFYRSPDAAITAPPEDFRGMRVHQTRLQGGDASCDSNCFTSWPWRTPRRTV